MKSKLKLKDNIDLKELEKLGFVYNPSTQSYDKHIHWWHIISVMSNRQIWVSMIFDDEDIDIYQAEYIDSLEGTIPSNFLEEYYDNEL